MAHGARDNGFDENEGFDLGRAVRGALWALAATAAVSGAVVAARSEAGARRFAQVLEALPLGFAAPARPTRVASHEAAAGAEARRLSDTVAALMADRDRMAARIEALERVPEVTGSVPASATARSADPASAAASLSRLEAPSLSDVTAADSVATRTEFGVDLGRDVTLDGLRGQWAALKTQHAGLLDGLRAIVAVRESGSAGPAELRLVAGPLVNAASAARLCATLSGVGIACQPAAFDGQRLALR